MKNLKNKKITMSVYLFASVATMVLILGILLAPALSQEDGLMTLKVTINYADGSSASFETQPSFFNLFTPPSLTVYNMAGTEITGIDVDVRATVNYEGGNGPTSWSWGGSTTVSHQSFRISAPGSSAKVVKQTQTNGNPSLAPSGSTVTLKSFSISAGTLESWVASSYRGFDYEQWCYFDASASVTMTFNDGSTDTSSGSASAYIKYQVEPSGTITGLTISIQDGYMY